MLGGILLKQVSPKHLVKPRFKIVYSYNIRPIKLGRNYVMAIFGGKDKKESKDDKKHKEKAELLEKLGLDELDDKDLETVKQIMTDLAGTGGLLGQVTSVTFSAADMQKVNASWAQVRQNWIIIRQLNKLNNNIEKIIAKE